MRIPARHGFPALSRPLVLILLRIEVVASIPSVVWTASVGYNNTGAESSELARTAIGGIPDVATRRNAQKILASLPSNKRS